MKPVTVILYGVLMGALVVPAHASFCNHESRVAAPAYDLVDVALEAGSFRTLITAAAAAGLLDALKADGPLTVFAPTDKAFAALPAGTVEELLKPARRADLGRILKHHVVARGS